MAKKVQSLQRAMKILRLFSLHRPYLGISEISRELNISKGTIQGMVQTLSDEGLLRKDPATRKYLLGLDLYELGVVVAGSLELNQKASAPANQLAKRTQRLISVAVRDNNTALITLDAYPRVEPFISRHFEPRRPLYCTAIGKSMLVAMNDSELEDYLDATKLLPYTVNTITKRQLLLAEVHEARLRGYAINRAEHTLTRGGIGAPILQRDGKLAGSIAIVISPDQITANEDRLSSEVKNAAAEISRYMGYFKEIAERMR
ncbi:MAG: IclR family transcriptional regulator [Deltaproteobacteria bacterium]|nr:IclR family transcriptional regulator [Deltaproteobacteria bacterium]